MHTYVYHYLFNRYRLVDAVRIYNPTEVAIPVIKSLALMKPFQHSRWNIHNLDSRVSNFLMSILTTRLATSRRNNCMRRKLDFARGLSQVLA